MGRHPGREKRFGGLLEDFVAVNVALRNYFNTQVVDGRPVLLFHHTIKYHYLLHVAERASHENVRLSWCYSGETLMRVVRDLIFSSCRGVPQRVVANKAMREYVGAIGYDLMEELREL